MKAPLSVTGSHSIPLNILKIEKSFSLRSVIKYFGVAYNDFLPVKKAKFDDIQSLLTYVTRICNFLFTVNTDLTLLVN